MNNSIIINADRLKRNNIKKKLINTNINSILYKINTAIDMSFKKNQTNLLFNLPISFDIPDSINHKDFQLEIYYNIINILESKNYKVNIKLLENESILKILWIFAEENEINTMKNKLKSLMFK